VGQKVMSSFQMIFLQNIETQGITVSKFLLVKSFIRRESNRQEREGVSCQAIVLQ